MLPNLEPEGDQGDKKPSVPFAPAPKPKKSRRHNPDQREMLLPIPGGAGAKAKPEQQRLSESALQTIESRTPFPAASPSTSSQVLEYLAREWEKNGVIDAQNMRHVYRALEAEKKAPIALDAALARGRTEASQLPAWIELQRCRKVDQPPTGSDWIHEPLFEGLRIAARLDGGEAQLLTSAHLDVTSRYPGIAEAVEYVPVESAYFDGVLTGVDDQGSPNGTGDLVYHAFDLLNLDGAPIRNLTLAGRKARLKALKGRSLRFEIVYEMESGDAARGWASRLGLRGIVSKRIDAPYEWGANGHWLESALA